MNSSFVHRIFLGDREEPENALVRIELEFATVTLNSLGLPTTLGVMWFAKQIDEGSGIGARPLLRFAGIDSVEYAVENDHLWIEFGEGETLKSVGAPVAVYVNHLEPKQIEIQLDTMEVASHR
jgi:hypothetical protein